MPLYEYVCPKCGHPFEMIVSFSQADRPQECPSCGHDQATKQISRIAMHSVGSGASASAGAASSAASCSTGFG